MRFSPINILIGLKQHSSQGVGSNVSGKRVGWWWWSKGQPINKTPNLPVPRLRALLICSNMSKGVTFCEMKSREAGTLAKGQRSRLPRTRWSLAGGPGEWNPGCGPKGWKVGLDKRRARGLTYLWFMQQQRVCQHCGGNGKQYKHHWHVTQWRVALVWGLSLWRVQKIFEVTAFSWHRLFLFSFLTWK